MRRPVYSPCKIGMPAGSGCYSIVEAPSTSSSIRLDGRSALLVLSSPLLALRIGAHAAPHQKPCSPLTDSGTPARSPSLSRGLEGALPRH